jgi:hypothetical protein
VGIKVAPCDGSSYQLWTQGFSSDPARELRNLASGLSLTLKPKLVQRLDIGKASQRWVIRAV